MGLFTAVKAVRSREVTVLRRHLENLSRVFRLWIDDGYAYVIVEGVRLPPGFDQYETEILIELPRDYPVSPPGVGTSHIYVNPSLRYLGRQLSDVHSYATPSFETPGFGPWHWWCYRWIKWDPHRDNLISLVELVRANMTQPPTE